MHGQSKSCVFYELCYCPSLFPALTSTPGVFSNNSTTSVCPPCETIYILYRDMFNLFNMNITYHGSPV